MTEDMLDNLYDCLNYLNEIQELDELKDHELKIINEAYDIIEYLYNKNIVK